MQWHLFRKLRKKVQLGNSIIHSLKDCSIFLNIEFATQEQQIKTQSYHSMTLNAQKLYSKERCSKKKTDFTLTIFTTTKINFVKKSEKDNVELNTYITKICQRKKVKPQIISQNLHVTEKI